MALVTGGARGIGAAICRRLARAGCGVCINYYSSSDEAEELRGELEGAGVRAFTFQANVTDLPAVKEMFEAIREEFGNLDILVSNAASGVLRPALEMTTKHWRGCLETTEQVHDICYQAVWLAISMYELAAQLNSINFLRPQPVSA